MEKKTLLTSGKLSVEFKEFINREYPEIKCLQTDTAEEIAEILPQANYVAGFNFLDGYDISHLEWIHSFGAGVDSFMQLTIPENCMLSKTTGKMGQRMGEYCLTFVLEDLKQSLAIHQNQDKKDWHTPEQKSLFDQSIYILGTGYVGQEIAKIFIPLAKSVTGVNSSGQDSDEFTNCISVDTLFQDGIKDHSILINALPLTRKTRGLIDEKIFKKLTNCMLINVGRANTINEEDLISALSNNNIRKAVLDVFEKEPLEQSSPIWENSKCIVTPHLSGPTTIKDITESFIIAYNQLKTGMVNSQFINKEKGY